MNENCSTSQSEYKDIRILIRKQIFGTILKVNLCYFPFSASNNRKIAIFGFPYCIFCVFNTENTTN